MTTTRRPGIKDVASLAGVSIKTVSRVMNAEQAVHPDTRDRVLRAVHELGYVPNTAARSLKSGRGDLIGVLIDSAADPFFAALVSAIEERALAEGLSILVASTGLDAEREHEQLLTLIAGHQVAGVVLAPVAVEHPYLDAHRASLPVVAVDRPRDHLDSVVVDDIGATRLAIEQLVSLGHRRIAFFDFDERFLTVMRRFEGYRQVLADRGIPYDPELVAFGETGAADYPVEAQRLLEIADPATAFFASNARAAIGLAAALHRIDRPDTAFISFGDFSLADALRPAVTCIDHDPFRIGNAAIELLLELRGSESTERREVVVPTRLIQRGSGEIAAPERLARGAA